MASIGERVQQADWKKEKHVPVIECVEQAKAGELLEIKVTLGKEIAHPNTTEHHISWISLYFLADGDKFVHNVGRYEFAAHGESTAGPNQGPVYAQPMLTTWVKIGAAGTFYAVAMCNIHGLWESNNTVKLA